MRKPTAILTGAALLAAMTSFSLAQHNRPAHHRAAMHADGPEGVGGPGGVGGADRGQRPQLQGPGADVARAAIESMGQTRQATVTALRERVQTGLQAVRTLDENEAPNEAIELAAQQARDAIIQTVIRADTALATEALDTVQTLGQLGAEQQTTLAVIRARQINQAVVQRSAMRAGHALHKAVAIATGELDPDALRERRANRGPRGPRGPQGGHGQNNTPDR